MRPRAVGRYEGMTGAAIYPAPAAGTYVLRSSLEVKGDLQHAR